MDCCGTSRLSSFHLQYALYLRDIQAFLPEMCRGRNRAMTDQHRNALRVAQAFCKVFIDSADHEIKGGDPSWREESAMHLAAALRNLNPPAPDVPVVDWRDWCSHE